MRLNDYIAYFKNKAVLHKDIGHDPSDNPAPGKTRFASYNYNDVIMKQLRVKIGFPALMCEIYETQFSGDNYYAARGLYRGAFMIVGAAKFNNPADEIKVLSDTELILWDIVTQLYQDHYGPEINRCSTPFAGVDIDKADITSFGPIWENSFGWRFEFGFRPAMPRSLSEPLPEGTFLTP